MCVNDFAERCKPDHMYIYTCSDSICVLRLDRSNPPSESVKQAWLSGCSAREVCSKCLCRCHQKSRETLQGLMAVRFAHASVQLHIWRWVSGTGLHTFLSLFHPFFADSGHTCWLGWQAAVISELLMVFFGPSLAPRRPSEEHITVSKERCIQAEAKRQIASRTYRTLMYEQLLHPKVCSLSRLVTVLWSCFCHSPDSCSSIIGAQGGGELRFQGWKQDKRERLIIVCTRSLQQRVRSVKGFGS